MKKLWVGISIGACLVGGLGDPASGATFRWASASSGSFSFDGNWTPAGGPPNDGNDSAIFDVLGVYTTRIHSDVTNHNFEVRVGGVTFDLYQEEAGQFGNLEFGYIYTLDATTGIGANISSFPGALFAVTLTVEGDSEGFPAGGEDAQVRTSAPVHIGSEANSNGTLEITRDAEWINASLTLVGNSGQGTMNLRDGGEMSNTAGVVGFLPGSDGTVLVTGGSSRWDNNATLTVGAHGTADMTIEDGGVVTNDDNGFIATIAGQSSTVTIDDGQWFNGASLFVGGNTVAAAGNATLTLEDNSPNFRTTRVEVDDNMVIRSTGTVNMIGTGGSALEVAGQLTVDAGGELNITGAFADLTVGSIAGGADTINWTAGTVNITNGDFTVDPTSPTGFLLPVSTGMALNVSDTLRVGSTASSLLIVANGAQVSSGDVHVGSTGTSSIAVDGSGTSLTIARDITLGSTSGAGGQLTVTEQATASNHDTFMSPTAGLHSESLIQSLNGGTAQWDVAGSFYLGGDATNAGGTAELTVNAGGALNIVGQFRVWDQATVDVDTGTITTPLMHVAGQVTYTGTLDLTGAGPITALTLDGGSVTADEIDLGATDFTGHGTLAGDVIASGDITANGDLTLGDPSSFTALQLTGPLDVGAHTVTLHKAGFFNIGAFTTIAGGTLNVPNGTALPVGNSILAHGAITGRLVQQSGSAIIANGDLTLGDDASVAGFFSDGELAVNDHTVTLLDANEAVLGSLTTLGDGAGNPGTLVADNGLIVEFGKNITGHGTVDTPNDPTTPLINNGFIGGDSVTEPITLNGYVKGVGSFANIIINGTLSPGFSPGHITVQGDLVLSDEAVLEMEIAGLSPRTEYDQITILGDLIADGTLKLTLLNGFRPRLGDRFELFNASTFNGAFDSLWLPTLTHGLAIDTQALLTTGQITIIPDPSTSTLITGLIGLATLARLRRS